MGSISWYRRLFSPAVPSSDPEDIRGAAEEGNAEAQYAMGFNCCTARVEHRDLSQGARWYRKAADQGHASAQFHLALMLADGQGVPKDEGMALIWIRKAADGGDAGAQFNLGSRFHRASLGQSQMDSVESRTEAYKWLQLSAAQGYYGSVAACERVNLSMNRAEVLDGNERVAAFAARKPLPPLEPAYPVSQE